MAEPKKKSTESSDAVITDAALQQVMTPVAAAILGGLAERGKGVNFEGEQWAAVEAGVVASARRVALAVLAAKAGE